MAICACGRKFYDTNALRQHQRTKRHCFCRDCDRFFTTSHGFEQHNLALHNWLCEACNNKFSAQENLAQHQKSTGHCYCNDCDRCFVSSEALQQHRRSSLHASEYRCCDCNRDFVSERALEQHLIDKVHTVSRKHTSDFACRTCNRDFWDKRALEQHQASLIHQPISDVKCITGKWGLGMCRRRFTSPSALLHHLESGACPSGVTRLKLNSTMQANDVDRMISNPNEIIRAILFECTRQRQVASSPEAVTPSTDSLGDIVVVTPSSSSTQVLTPGSDYYGSLTTSSQLSSSTTRCPLCPRVRRPFPTPQSLQQHLDSPAHTARTFHCPVSFFPMSGATSLPGRVSANARSFSTLSGLAQHLESGACGGGTATFRKVAEYMEARLKEIGLKKVELLI